VTPPKAIRNLTLGGGRKYAGQERISQSRFSVSKKKKKVTREYLCPCSGDQLRVLREEASEPGRRKKSTTTTEERRCLKNFPWTRKRSSPEKSRNPEIYRGGKGIRNYATRKKERKEGLRPSRGPWRRSAGEQIKRPGPREKVLPPERVESMGGKARKEIQGSWSPEIIKPKEGSYLGERPRKTVSCLKLLWTNFS